MQLRIKTMHKRLHNPYESFRCISHIAYYQNVPEYERHKEDTERDTTDHLQLNRIRVRHLFKKEEFQTNWS